MQSFVEGPVEDTSSSDVDAFQITQEVPYTFNHHFPLKFPAFDRNAAFSSWPDCVKLSESFHFRPPEKSLPGYLDPDPALSQKLALVYKRWSCASENFLLLKCETEGTDRKKFLGRGSETSFRLKPVVQRISPGEEHFADQECRFWSWLLSRLRFLALLVERDKGIKQHAGIITYIRNTRCPRLRSMILKTDLEARKRGLCEVLHQLQLVTQGTLNAAKVISDVASFLKEAQYAVVSKSCAGFRQWCHNSLAKGAAGAHAFLRKDDEPPQIHVTFNDKRGDGSDPCTAPSLRSDTWRRHWTKHESYKRADQLATAFEQAREKAVNFQNVNGLSSFFTVEQVTGALRAMKSERARGLLATG